MIQNYLRALRPVQWVKNVLVFVPLIAAHETGIEPYLVASIVFLALSTAASSGYLLNDVLDLPHDRTHVNKRNRPLAARQVSLLPVCCISIALGAIAFALAFSISMVVGLLVMAYLSVSILYSSFFKRIILFDVITLAVLFTLRVYAGAAAVSITLTPWFLAFFIFIFLSLAMVKRLNELRSLEMTGLVVAEGRPYLVQDLPVIASLAAANTVAAVVVLALYIQSKEVARHYAQPEFLWLALLLLLYWLMRMVLLANRALASDDPIYFALTDWISWLVGISIISVFIGAL
ncbi:MAG: UbiA family prenyltransferase [Gammaproteobacteria bacterium]|nr:UbiA family prenyltransferase [Gammaproteobacteria bacterium]MCY4338409.1 UbiA family prenyltransferase [Gammaproteobacteria bacterium]